MKNITKASIENDYKIICDIHKKYTEAILENQQGQEAHYDNQSKLAKISIGDIRAGLYLTIIAFRVLRDIDIIEDTI